MSHRISLTRIVALNWYGFRQIFEVEDNVLISGAFGTGKSALLDLLQYVLLGEHWRANRAAAGNARGRDLVGYCLGDTNQTRNGQRHFLRQNGVTLVALEFTKLNSGSNQAPQRETWGIRLEFTTPESAPKSTYFYLPDRLNYSDVAPDGKLLPDDAFRTWIRREYGAECLFSRQRDYLEEMAAPRHLNFDSTAFHRTFPKAIAFEPEENVERFIREFILEESPLDVREVRNALRAYDDTRKRLEQQEHEADILRRICTFHQTFENCRREEAVLNHVHFSLKHQQAEESWEMHQAALKKLEEEHAADSKELQNIKVKADQVRQLLEGVRFEVQKDPDSIKIADLERQKKELQVRVSVLRESQKSSRKHLDDLHYRWTHWLRHGQGLPLDGLQAVLTIDERLLAALRSNSEMEGLRALPSLANQFHEIWRKVEHLLAPLRAEKQQHEKRLRQLAEDLEKLERGEQFGSFPLFESVRERLGDSVQQLARLIEVKPEEERWWPALELYLGRNRWVLVPNDQNSYRQALDLLSKTPPGREPESLLNPAEARQLPTKVRAGSLFEKVEVNHPVAKAYVQHLLGEVLCVENIEQLESADAPRAITPEGIYKQAPLRRRLKPADSVTLTLGAEGLQRMRKGKLIEQEETRQFLRAVQQQLSDVNGWIDTGKKGGLSDAQVPVGSSDLSQLPELEAELNRHWETIQLLMTPEREERQKKLVELEQSEREILAKQAVLKDRNTGFEMKVRPVREALQRAEEDRAAARLSMEESRVQLSSRFPGILEKDLQNRRDSFQAEFPKWNACFEAVQSRKEAAATEAIAAREKRNTERMLLATERDSNGHLRHPEYQHDFNHEEEHNDPWSARLDVLETVELTRSRELAADRKKDWERRLEENVLNELNRRIGDAQQTIRLLDRYLSQPIGKHRYRITQRRDTAGYAALWTLLDSGLEPTDPLLAAVQQSELQRAKEELMRAVDAPEQGEERSRRVLDYRNYHHYDIEMVPAEKPDAPPISMSKSGRNLSGGENQAPFFISMLAAFRRVYDRGDRSSSRSQQLGLVVMDEAFSKLSGDGIDDCLALARSFQLQLIMAFPPERLGVMVPHAQTVIMCQKEVVRDSQGYVTRISNIPLITTMADALEALS